MRNVLAAARTLTTAELVEEADVHSLLQPSLTQRQPQQPRTPEKRTEIIPNEATGNAQRPQQLGRSEAVAALLQSTHEKVDASSPRPNLLPTFS